MTLPLRRKHPTTAPNSQKGKEGTSFSWDKQPCLSFFRSSLRWTARAFAAGGISAAVVLTGFCGEPSYFTDEDLSQVSSPETRQADAPQPTSQATVLRWKTSRISRGSEG